MATTPNQITAKSLICTATDVAEARFLSLVTTKLGILLSIDQPSRCRCCSPCHCDVVAATVSKACRMRACLFLRLRKQLNNHGSGSRSERVVPWRSHFSLCKLSVFFQISENFNSGFARNLALKV